MTYSNDFSNASWSKTNTTITTDGTLSPLGTIALKLTEDLNTGEHNIIKLFTGTGTNRLISIFVKASGRTKVQLAISYQTSQYDCTFDLTTKIFSFIGTELTYVGYQDYPNGWIRIWAGVSNSTSAIIRLRLNNGISSTYTGDGVSGVYISASQAEEGSYPTSYIPTTTTAVTRVADSFSRNNIFTNGLITSSGGTWFLDLSNNIPISRISGNTSGIFLSTTTSATLGNGFTLRNVPGSIIRLQIVKIVNGIATSLYVTSNNNVKIAIKWDGLTADIFENGVKVISSTSFTSTDMENMVVDGTPRIISVKSITIFPSPLSDQECINLTTI
jgi:hypothetical protein